MIPFKLAWVEDVYTEDGLIYININKENSVPQEFILGVVIKILDSDDPLLEYF